MKNYQNIERMFETCLRVSNGRCLTINAEVKLPALECHFRHIQAVRLEKVI